MTAFPTVLVAVEGRLASWGPAARAAGHDAETTRDRPKNRDKESAGSVTLRFL